MAAATAPGEIDHQTRVLCSADPDRIILASRLITHSLMAYDNVSVYALVGNAANENLQVQIQEAKGLARGAAEPVGCTMPFTDPLLEGVYDTASITDPALRDFLEDPQALTEHFGAIAFLRGPGNPTKKDNKSGTPEGKSAPIIPDSIFPPLVNEASTFQNWSPEGNELTNVVVRSAIARGAIVAMSSLNPSGKPEITDESGAREFTAQQGLPLMTKPEADRPHKPRGSYLTYLAKPDGLSIIRIGNVDLELAVDLVPAGVRVELDEGRKQPDPKFPDRLLTKSDLPEKAWTAKGAELRKYVLQAMGVDR